MSIRQVSSTLIKSAGALALSCTVLGYVAEHAGPQEGRAVIHVTEPHVDVWVDGRVYRVESWPGEPILCPLRPGRHTLRMSRGNRTLFEQTFTVRDSDDVVLTAWDPARLGRTEP